MTDRPLKLAKRHPTLLLFFACAFAVVAVLAWLTTQVLELERREARARAESAIAESVRTALWRLDSALTPLLTQEAARPYFHYAAFYPAERAYNRLLQPVKDGEVLVPSPLLAGEPEFVRLHFQLASDGAFTSPRVPTGNLRDLAESQYVAGAEVISAESLLVRIASARGNLVESIDNQRSLLTRIEAAQPWSAVLSTHEAPVLVQQVESSPTDEYSQKRAAAEKQQRYQTANEAVSKGEQVFASNNRNLIKGNTIKGQASADLSLPMAADAAAMSADLGCVNNVEQMRLTPAWVSLAAPPPPAQVASDSQSSIGLDSAGSIANAPASEPELMLLRTINLDGQSLVQGAWLDWPALRESLLVRVRDLLPSASLRPARNDELLGAGETLASIPAVLEVGESPAALAAPPTLGLTPTRFTLLFAWSSLLGAVAAIGLALRASTELGERRGRFVSAVTHELRTPLTTFCLYSQMLADGMITEPGAQREYLGTLKKESERLSRIVENVLCYARLSDLRAGVHTERADAGEVLQRIVPRLEARAAEAGMILTADTAPVLGKTVLVDSQTLERILINLVDNACKYAAEADDRRIHLEARVRNGDRADASMIEVLVADHGPGVPRREWGSIFKAFERGAAARSEMSAKPGLGLGLSLARGLAREQGGELRLLAKEGFGAVFCVAVPITT